MCGDGMPFDKVSFLSGVAAGRNMESWPAFVPAEEGALIITIYVGPPEPGTGIQDHYGAILISGFGSSNTIPSVPNWSTTDPVSFIAFWGDGTSTEYSMTLSQSTYGISHHYDEYGEYRVAIYGLPSGTSLGNGLGVPSPIVEIKQLPGTLDPPALTDFYRLETVTGNIFKWYRDNSAGYVIDSTKFIEVFRSCSALTHIPGNVFDGISFSSGAFNLNYFFAECDNLESVDSGILSNLAFTSATSADSMFRDNPNLTSVPSDIFLRLENVTNFSSCFRSSGISEIPRNIFQYTPLGSNFSFCFALCESLSYVSNDIFSGIETSTPNFRNAFIGCTALRHCPPLWETWPNANARQCFFGCTNADNYAQVPSGWK